MGSSRVALSVVLVTVMIAVLFTVVLGEGEDGVCEPYGDSSAAGGGVPDGELSKPLKTDDYQISSRYKSAERPGHRGIDLAAPTGTPMYAMASGVVTQAGPASGFGNWIVIDHQIDDKSYSTVYGHMYDDGVDVAAGDTVKAGQHIGEVGNNGQSTGAHLHFEVWEGSRQAGTETDPEPWIDQAVDPGQGPSNKPDGDTSGDGDKAPSKRVSRDRTSSTGGELQPTSKLIPGEDKLQIDTIRGARAVALRFPELVEIGSWRASDPFPDHPSGRAIDVMIPNYESSEGVELGNRVMNYFMTHKEHFNVEYQIWRQEYIPAEGTPNRMDDQGGPTANHYDHVHITFDGAGFPAPGQKYGEAPTDGNNDSSSVTGSVSADCADVGDKDLHLDEAAIPPELRKWIVLAGRECEAVDAPLIAGLIYHESAGFQAQALSPAGAQGYGQFMPGTWAGVGAKVDENGQVVGAPGSGSPADPADATMAVGRYLCELAEGQKEGIASGELAGDSRTLMLAAYNAGPGAVQQFDGVPPYAETQNYVVIVPQEASRFAAAVQGE
ncbi:MAG: peptidoglycan DD-metalloendopeptidase family protein [Dietzia psychralcaliphila]